MAVILGGAALGAIGLWLFLLAALAAATRPRTPEPMPAGLEFGGHEPPAVVNLLTSDWRLEPEAMAATLVDLAARRVVAFEQSAPDQFAVRVDGTSGARTELASYERDVLDHVRKLAHGGVVPLAALNEGGGGDHGWWKRFEKAVLAHARGDGLSRPRWSGPQKAVLTVTAVIPGLPAGAAAVSAFEPESDDVLGLFAFAAGLVWFGLLAVFARTNDERDTDAGLAAAGRWLGLRENLAANPMFASLPPTGITMWDRYLAYAAAMGLATTTLRTIPLGEHESARRAWSAVGGEWRLVTVRYPDVTPPRWGRPPGRTIVVGVALAAVIAAIIYTVARFVLPTFDDLGGTEPIRLAVLAAVGLLAADALLLVGLGVSDVGRGEAIEGRVVRLRTRKDKDGKIVFHHVAVDTGTRDKIRAWKLWTAPYVRQGAWVRAVVTPRLGFVRSLETVAPGSGSPVPTSADR
ncbi:MAG: DUF2207 family protein [Acidimicrobiales bacterium]